MCFRIGPAASSDGRDGIGNAFEYENRRRALGNHSHQLPTRGGGLQGKRAAREANYVQQSKKK